MLKEALQPGDIDSRIRDLLKRTPSGPDFGMSTLRYYQDAIEISLNKFASVLTRQYPPQEPAISQRLDRLKSTFVTMPDSDFIVSDNRLCLRPPHGNMLYANYILQSVYSANPRLGAFEYAVALYLPKPNKYAAERHPGFEMRYRNIIQTGDLPLDHPYCQTIAVAFFTQTAKIKGIEAARKLLYKASSYGGMAGPEFIDQNIASINSQVREV